MEENLKSIDSIYPLTIVRDRYDGTYSGGKYLAFNEYWMGIPDEIEESDDICAGFWAEHPDALIGKGNSAKEACEDLLNKLNNYKEEE